MASSRLPVTTKSTAAFAISRLLNSPRGRPPTDANQRPSLCLKMLVSTVNSLLPSTCCNGYPNGWPVDLQNLFRDGGAAMASPISHRVVGHALRGKKEVNTRFHTPIPVVIGSCRPCGASADADSIPYDWTAATQRHSHTFLDTLPGTWRTGKRSCCSHSRYREHVPASDHSFGVPWGFSQAFDRPRSTPRTGTCGERSPPVLPGHR